MGIELRTTGETASESVSIGERVKLEDAETEYVVVDIDHASGRLELLRLKPGRIESGIPVSAVKKSSENHPSVLARGDD